eukprot:4082890-Ditylum_brightwellii.AAC.1
MGKTHKDQSRAWKIWGKYCGSIGIINDVFIGNFTRHQWIQILRAFAVAVHCRRFSGQAHDILAEGTVRGTISYVTQTFRDNDRPNLTKDEDGKFGRLLHHQFRAFRTEGPNQVQQKALPICVLREVAKKKHTESQ